MADWFENLWQQTKAIPLPVLVLGIGLLTAQTLLVALSWRNILRFAYPDGGVRYRSVLSYYAGGVGLNSILPASAGTVAMLGLFRADVEGSTVAGLVGATVVENLFFAVAAVAVYLWLFLSVSGSFDVHLRVLDDHPFAAVLIAVAVAVVVGVVVRILWRRLRKTWKNAKEGGAILSHPRLYATEVVGPQLGSYVARMGVNAAFMHAYGIPVSLRNVLLIVAASSLSSTVALTPGGVGAQTALTSVVLGGVAPASVVTAYAVGQQLIVTAWNVLLGFALLATAIGWRGTRALLHSRGRSELDEAAPDEETA